MNTSIEIQGKIFSLKRLKDVLDTAQKALLFAAALKLSRNECVGLLTELGYNSLYAVLTEGGHSEDLQSYIVELGFKPEDHFFQEVSESTTAFGEELMQDSFLANLLASATIVVADKVQQVAAALASTLSSLEPATAKMTFEAVWKYHNASRSVRSQYAAMITHEERKVENLVILDVSGSMSEYTVTQIVDEVVALAVSINAHLAIVSNNTYMWEPGHFNTEGVLSKAEYSGTHYETLVNALNAKPHWGTVVTIADYDSSMSARQVLKQRVTTEVQQVLDISLVDKTTHLAECVAQFSHNMIDPILQGRSPYVIN